MLAVTDKLFFVLHAMLIAFVLVGWVWHRTRPLHLAVTALVAFSWFVLGAYYGIGYCLLTDWHLQIRRGMGRDDPSSSYIQLLASEGFGLSLDRAVSDWLGGGLFVLMLVAVGGAWWRHLGSGRTTQETRP